MAVVTTEILNVYINFEYDDETGNYYCRTRFYSPTSGRFLSEDPIRFAGLDANLYRYVGNNPINFIDPYGLAPGDIFPTINEAGVDAINYINSRSIREGREYGGYIYGNELTGYTYHEPIAGDEGSVTLPPPPFNVVADFHTHGSALPGQSFENFSAADIKSNNLLNIPGFLGTPRNNFFRYDPYQGASTPRLCQ